MVEQPSSGQSIQTTPISGHRPTPSKPTTTDSASETAPIAALGGGARVPGRGNRSLGNRFRRNELGTVFWTSVGVSTLFVGWAVAFTENLNDVTTNSLNWMTSTFGWTYLVVTLCILVFLVFLAFSPAGDIRLGRNDEKPEFSTPSWLAMILSAVMGIGLISYGVAEPISHFASPPHGLAEPKTTDAAVRAMQYSYFDWGVHAWAIFAVFGLAIAYSTHRKGRRTLVSQLFHPLLGDRVNGPLGKTIDVLAVFATLFGTTTSLGLGALQVNNGLATLFGTPVDSVSQVLIIAVVTALFTLSAVTGVNKGIKFLSQCSTALAIALFAFILVVGPAVFVANLYIESLGTWASDFFRMSLQGTAFGDLEWMQWWTYFMLAWWVSWGAFVGVFLARISRGRTIRGFIMGVLVVPSAVFFTWFTVFGGTAIHIDMYEGGDIAERTAADINSAFFATLEHYPFATATSVIAIVLVVVFFVSGADANTYVLSMMTSNGSLTPARWILVLWGVLTGITAIVLMLAGGLNALQNTVIVTSLPFLVIVAGLTVSFWRELVSDRKEHMK
ncbi:BCCT family transporter [Rhodococcus sp. NPDC057529]|uniref:BCCT family transporter n=1 Tax=Rhodococcus sp. NPDC057529 TaxID=3346158 RepID=UPI00366D3061